MSRSARLRRLGLPQRPAYVPRSYLVDSDAWRTRTPEWKPGIPPGLLMALTTHHRLAWELRRWIKSQGLDREEIASRLGTSRSNLWRLLDGYSPISLSQAGEWAALIGWELHGDPASPPTGRPK